MIVEVHVNQAAGSPSEGIPTVVSVPAGCWALSTRSTVPFVAITYAGREEVLTWGERADVPKGQNAVIVSQSLHAGDIMLTTSTPVIPGCVSIPAEFQSATIGGVACYQSRVIDVRGAHRAFLCLNQVVGDLTVYTTHKSFRTQSYGDNTWATGQGAVQSQVAAVQYSSKIPLGIGSGSWFDTGPGAYSLQDNTPQCLLDTLQVYLNTAQANATGWLKAVSYFTDAFFVLEYR